MHGSEQQQGSGLGHSQENTGGYYPPDESHMQGGGTGSGLMGHSTGSFLAPEDRVKSEFFYFTFISSIFFSFFFCFFG